MYPEAETSTSGPDSGTGGSSSSHPPPARRRRAPSQQQTSQRRQAAASRPSPGDDTTASLSAEAEAAAAHERWQRRRAQVRRAQAEHRQRKANQVRQLELEVAEMRDHVTDVERECRRLRAENEAMRGRLALTEAGAGAGLESITLKETDASSGAVAPGGESAGDAIASTLDASADDMDVLYQDFDPEAPELRLVLDETLGTPIWQFTSLAPPSYGILSQSPEHPGWQPAYIHGEELPELTPAETQQAINFILALEYLCWDHFHLNDFDPCLADNAEQEENGSGHHMMATSLAMNSAPDTIFDDMAVIRAAAAEAEARGDGSGSTEAPTRPPPGTPLDISWRASGVTLTALYGLAMSLNPSAELELTPVQAWFELAACWPRAVLLRDEVVTRLKEEFRGVVKCPHYGTLIEREAFESVSGRVLGPLLAEMEGEMEVAGGIGVVGADGGGGDT